MNYACSFLLYFSFLSLFQIHSVIYWNGNTKHVRQLSRGRGKSTSASRYLFLSVPSLSLPLRISRSFTFFLLLFRGARRSDRFSSLKLVWSVDDDHLPTLKKGFYPILDKWIRTCASAFSKIHLYQTSNISKKFKCHLRDINPSDLIRYSCIHGLTQIVIFNSIAMVVQKWITVCQE